MSRIDDRVLSALDPEEYDRTHFGKEEFVKLKSELGPNPAEIVLAQARRRVQERGEDWVAVVEADPKPGKEARKKLLKDVEPDSRLVSSALSARAREGNADANPDPKWPLFALHTLMLNSVEFPSAVLGGWAAGGAVSAGDPGLTEEQIAEQIRMLRRKVSYVFLAAIPSTVEKAREALKKSGISGDGASCVLLLEADGYSNIGDDELVMTPEEIVASSGRAPPPEKKDNDDLSDSDPCLVLWSSGTTGAPKGIIHSRGTVLKSLESGTSVKPELGPCLQLVIPPADLVLIPLAMNPRNSCFPRTNAPPLQVARKHQAGYREFTALQDIRDCMMSKL